jgi:YD repeat-containing protein
LKIRYYQGQAGDPWRSCGNPGDLVPETYVGTVTHPSGAVGEFTLQPQRFKRSGVPAGNCSIGDPDDVNDDSEWYPIAWDAYSLMRKQVSGIGLATTAWTYAYSLGNSTEVFGPGDYLRYTHGNTFRTNEGKLLSVARGTGASNILSTESYGYALAQSGMRYPTPVGVSGQSRSDDFTEEYPRPTVSTNVTRQGVTFTSQVNVDCEAAGVYCLDRFARPLSMTKSSTLGYSKTDTTMYHDNLGKWVLGQVATQATDGVQSARTEYDANAMPWKTYAFGKLQQTLAYDTTSTVASGQRGTLKTVTDGRSYVTTLTNWHRGIPRSIRYPVTDESPAGATQSAVVDNNGWITSVTDENGYATGYDYDLMGRLERIDYPTGDTPAWNSTHVTFAPATTAKYGIAAGHWQQTVNTGNARKVIYFDALWRPLVEEAYDNANEAGTRSVSVKHYDSSGRLAFQSYPLRTLSNYATVTAGTSTTYDALDRPTLVRQTSELGNLDTTTQYLSGFKTRVTLPKHQGTSVYTETSYYAWDQPTTDLPKTIAQPEGVLTTIARDVFGKPTAITRGGGGVSATRSYVYNTAQELCKTIEPETGSTVMHYDGAGNLDWSAAGLVLPSTTSCDDTHASIAARKVSRTYDARNRLKTLRFFDTRGDQDWTYTPDGLPVSITTVNVPGAVHPINQYVYNKRRMLASETQHLPAWYSFSLGYTYDANGNLKRINYPSSDYVDFAPNALGQATEARNAGGHAYADVMTYHPNGSVTGFTYGNGIAYQMSYPTDANATAAALCEGRQRARPGLPLRQARQHRCDLRPGPRGFGHRQSRLR